MEETRKGGIRIQGTAPDWKKDWPVVSVITVVYNGSRLIETTVRSILGQTYPNIEYLIIDGGSKDETVDIIRRYEDRIHYWSSEPDKGIYDAMNKGLAAATGDYVWFMNAGDRIYREDTLEQILRAGNTSENPVLPDAPLKPWPLIYYGDTMIVDAEYREIGLRRLRPPENLTWKSFRHGMLVCHQAILVARKIAEPFDPQYSHSADYDWVLRALIRATKTIPELPSGGIVNTRLILCAFLDGGHSKQNIAVSLKERFHSMVRHYGWLPTVVRHLPIAVRFFWYWVRKGRF